VGEGGEELENKYSTGIRTLLGCHSRGFPNLYIMGGYQASFAFNLVDILREQGRHIARCIDYCRSHEDAKAMDCTSEAEEW
jgi:cyclohexanone monooxygenase